VKKSVFLSKEIETDLREEYKPSSLSMIDSGEGE
jgi:hypothetical protein